MTFASSGNGSSDHLTAELFWQQTGTTGLHVPYKGGAPAITDLLGGQVDASFQNVNAVLQHIKAGKLRRARRHRRRSARRVLPDVPTLAEAGVKNVDVYSWQAVVGAQGPAGRRAHASSMTAVVGRAQRAAGQAAVHRARLRDRRQHAGAVRRLPAAGVRALEEGHRDRARSRRTDAARSHPNPASAT